MTDTLKNIELIEEYYEGRLDARARIAFENRLLIDEELKEEYELYKAIVTVIKENGNNNLKNQMKIADAELDNAAEVKKLISPKQKYLAMAASIILFIGIAFFWKYTTDSKLSALADKYYDKEKGLPIEMTTNKGKYDDVMNLYKQVDYNGAKNEINKLLVVNSYNDTLNYFLGVVTYELMDFETAKLGLNKIKLDSRYFEKAQYRIILIALKQNNKKLALAKIDEALKNKEHLFYNKISSLKEDLSN